MTDKEKIKNEIVQRKLCTMDEHMAFYSKEAEADYKLLSSIENFINSLPEEPVSEELEKVFNRYSEDIESVYSNDMFDRGDIFRACKYGAQCQKEHFEENRLKHCNSITNEQAELEQGFIDQHLDKYNRMPTFLDAIEYGMRLQKEQMMRGATDGQIENGEDYLRIKCLCMSCPPQYDGKLVRLIIIREGLLWQE